MIDVNRLANVIFDKGVKIQEQEYSSICESIRDDRFTLNEHVIGYKQKDSICEGVFFQLKDDSRILISEEALNMIRSLKIDQNRLVEFMSGSRENFQSVLREILNGIE